MRRFFFFRSNSSDDQIKTPPMPAGKNNCQNLQQGDVAFSGSRTPDDSVSKSRKRYADEQDLSSSHLKRSLSFSSPAPRHCTDDFDSNYPLHFSGSPPTYHNSSQSVSDCPNHQHLVRPDNKHTISRNRHKEIHYFDHSNSDSLLMPSVAVRCQSSHITNLLSKSSFLDVYIEGEQWKQETNNKPEDSLRTFPTTTMEADSLSRRMSALDGLQKPPRPCSRESNSFRDARDFESETTSSVEDIYEDTSDTKAFPSNGFTKISDVDEALMRKAQEVDEIFVRLSEENIESHVLKLKGVTTKSLHTIIQEINEDRKLLALELSAHIKSRLAERFDFKEKYRRLELEAHMRNEMEKSELHLDGEREFSWHPNDWSVKVGKYELEEMRLRERIRELAEQNVSLQREISALKSNEGEVQAKIADYEEQLDRVRRENVELKQSLTEMNGNFEVTERELGHFRTSYKDKEEEARAMHKTILRLQRTCADQEKSINSLRHDTKLRDKDSWYDTEISRLTGIEQNLRHEVESCRTEIEVLRHENIAFLDRLNKGENSRNGFVRLEEEIRQRVQLLQGKGLCLLDECSRVCNGLFKCIKNRNRESFEGRNGNEEGYSLIQYTLKCENIRKGAEDLKRSLQWVSSVLDEMSSVKESEEFSEHTNDPSEIGLEEQLKSVTLINKILRENLFSKEKEIELAQGEVASLVRGAEHLQSEMLRLQDEISCLTYKAKDMEIQTGKKEEWINQMQEELQETVKELTATRSMLKTAMEERDFASHELMNLQKDKKDLERDVAFLRERVEVLDEDLLFKDGQISILKESIDKPLRDLCIER